MFKPTTLRYFGNLLLLIGQGYVLYSNVDHGVVIKSCGAILLVPCLINQKMWDMIIVLTAFVLLDLSKLASNLL